MNRLGQDDFRGTDRFLIRRRLGAGAFGVVYEAFDRQRNAAVALKTLRRANVHALYRLKREFRALADISHPNLVALYELLADREEWFVVMELIRGANFLEYVRGKVSGQLPIPTGSWSPTLEASRGGAEPEEETWSSEEAEAELHRDAASLPASGAPIPSDLGRLRAALGQFAEGLCALHEAGKLHRDLKPSNVLVTAEGRVVLLDFGLVTELASPNTDEGLERAGTPTYMSPEIGAGRPVSEASDWYSMGVMLHEALTGRPPFVGPARQILREKQVSEPPAPSELAAGVPEDLNALCRDLLRTNPRARPSGRMVLQRLGRLSEAASRRIAEAALARGGAHLVGRERHLAALHEAFRASRRGRTVSISVHGTSGIGKTALIRGFLDELRQQERVVVLEGRCYERESVPYKALDSLVDALSQFLRGLPEARVRSILPGEAGALARLFPVFARVEAVAESGRGFLQIPDSQELRQRAFTALREILAGLGEEDPLVLFIDDLQWGDADSAALLSELLRPPDPPSLLLIASYRSEDAASSPLLRRLAALRTSAGHAEARELVVGELSPRDALRLALARLGPGCREADAEAIARESGGSPFFIDELVRHSQEGAEISPGGNAKAPETRLDEVIRARVRRLPEEARRLLEVVSVAGQPLELPVAKRAAYLRTDEPAVPALRAGHLIRSVGTEEREEIEPYHDRIRQAVVSSLSPDTLRDHHARLAVALEPSPRGDPETLALHFKESGNLERAATYAAEAADRAAEALAFDRAARLYRLALELGVTGRRLSIPLAKALANSGRGAEAAQAYLEATQGANPAQVLDLQRHAAEQFLISGRIDEGLKVLRVVLSSMGLKLAETPRLALLSLLLRRARILLRGLSFRERDAAKVPADDLIRIDACWSGAVGLGLVDPIRGNDFQGRHLLLALDAGEPYRVARALAMEAGYSSASGGRRSVRTERLLQMAVSLSERIQNPHATGLATLTAGIAAFLEGRWQAARHLTDRAEKILREECTGVSWERDNAHHYGLRSLFYLGEWAAMFRRLPGLLKEAQERGDLYAETNLSLRHLSVARMAADQIETAREELARSIESWSHGGFHVQHYYAWCARVEMALYSDAGQSAWELVARQWASLRRSLLDRVQFLLIESRHLRARAALAAAAGSRRLLGIAERDCRRIEHEQMPWGNALALLLRAGVSVGRGRTEKALALAASAEEQLTSTDMTVHAAAARRRRGELLGGEKGRDLMAQADAILVAQGIARPQAITAMLAPGPWRAGDGGEFRN